MNYYKKVESDGCTLEVSVTTQYTTIPTWIALSMWGFVAIAVAGAIWIR